MKFHVEKKDFDVNNILSILNEYGICVLKNYFSVYDIEKIFKELDILYLKVPEGNHGHFYSLDNFEITNKNDYLSGKSVCFYNSYDIIPSFRTMFLNDTLLNSILDKYFSKTCNRFNQIFTTREYNILDKDNLPRNAHIHLDPFESLKFAIFYPEVNEFNGALKVIPKSFKEGCYIRKNFITKSKPNSTGYSHTMNDFPSDMVTFTPEQIISINSSIGDVILLNTDNYHSGGVILEDGKYRNAIYVHNRP